MGHLNLDRDAIIENINDTLLDLSIESLLKIEQFVHEAEIDEVVAR